MKNIVKKLLKSLLKPLKKYSKLRLFLRVYFYGDILYSCYRIFIEYELNPKQDINLVLMTLFLCFILENLFNSDGKSYLNEIFFKYSLKEKHPSEFKNIELSNSQFFNELVITNIEIFGIILSVIYASYTYTPYIHKNVYILIVIILISFLFLNRRIRFHYKIVANDFQNKYNIKHIPYNYDQVIKSDFQEMKLLTKYNRNKHRQDILKYNKQIRYLRNVCNNNKISFNKITDNMF